MLRRIPIPVLTGAGGLLTIILIVVAAVFASRVIGETVLEQFRSQQLQTTTSVAQQTEAFFNTLNVEIIGLSQQTPIRTTATELQSTALSLIENTVIGRTNSVLSVTRFDSQGVPRYAYPATMNQLIITGEDYPYSIPPELVAITSARGAVNIETGVYRVPRNDQPSLATYLLITPVVTLNQNTEYLVYELNIEGIFAQTLNLALSDLAESESGQLWVFDNVDGRFERIFAAKTDPTIETIRSAFPTEKLASINEPTNETYSVGDTEREAALTPARAINRPFLIFVSRNSAEAREQVDQDLRVILFSAIGAIIGLALIGFLLTQRILSETTKLQAETGMRDTARSLLEVSRALNSTLEIDTVLDRILVEFERLIPYYSASILLLTSEGLEVVAHRGADEGAHQKVFALDEARAAREVIARGHPVIINDTDADERWTALEGSNIHSWMGMPLKVFDRSVGVLNINGEEANIFSPQDVNLAETFADQASVALQNARLHQMEVKRIEQELTIARSIQTSLLPIEAPDFKELEFAFEWVPARQVSGDFFQIIPLPDNQIGVVVGDVSGKGMPAAMIMAIVSTALRDEVNRHRNPGELLNALNKRLYTRLQQNNMNSALLTSLFNPTTHHFAVANAGMALPYVRDEKGEWAELEIGGYPLGSAETTNYTTKTIHFGQNSLMVLYSDGIIEAQNSRGEFFGFDRFEELLKSIPQIITAQEALQIILKAVQDHLGNESPQDDITVMVIRSLVVEPEVNEDEDLFLGLVDRDSDDRTWQEKFMARQSAVLEREGYPMPRENVEVFLPSTLGYEKVARDAAEAIAREMGFSDDRIDDLKTAVAEACMNAIEHGNLEDRSTSVTVLLSASSSHLEIRVEDRGRQQIPNPLPAPGGTDKSRGWGIFFIQSLMDEVEITTLPEGGNLVKMTIFLGQEGDENEDTEDKNSTDTE